MTEQRSFKVGDVINLSELNKLEIDFTTIIWNKTKNYTEEYFKLKTEMKKNFKLKIVELPEVDK